jgi:hypothetical protein
MYFFFLFSFLLFFFSFSVRELSSSLSLFPLLSIDLWLGFSEISEKISERYSRRRPSLSLSSSEIHISLETHHHEQTIYKNGYFQHIHRATKLLG